MSLSRGVVFISVLTSALLAEPRFVEADVSDRAATGGALTQLEGEDGCVDDNGDEGCAVGRALRFAMDVAVSQDGKNVYVVSGFVGVFDSGAVAVFDRDRKTGVLTQLDGENGCLNNDGPEGCAVGRALLLTQGVAVSPDGKNVYVASQRSNAVAVFARGRRTGALTQLDGEDGCVGDDGDEGCADGRALNGAIAVAVSPDGRNVYLASFGSSAVAVFARDSRTGALTQLDGEDGCVDDNGSEGCAVGRALDSQGVTVSRDGRHVYVASADDAVAVFARDSRTGALTQLDGEDGCVALPGPFAAEGCAVGRALNGPTGVAVSRDGRNVYLASFESDAVPVFARKRRTGVLTQLDGEDGCVALPDGAEGEGCADGRALMAAFDVAVSRDDKNVYVSSGAGAVAVFARDRKTGALIQLEAEDGCVENNGDQGCADGRALNGSRGVAVSRDGKNVYVASPGSGAVAVFARDNPTSEC